MTSEIVFGHILALQDGVCVFVNVLLLRSQVLDAQFPSTINFPVICSGIDWNMWIFLKISGFKDMALNLDMRIKLDSL